jgi:hypothetical protein
MADQLSVLEAMLDESPESTTWDTAALDRAAEEANQEPVVEPTQEPVVEQEPAEQPVAVEPEPEVPVETPPPVETEDNAERSRLGRRLANMERQHQQEMQDLKMMLAQQNQAMTMLMQKMQPQPQAEPEDDYIPTTRAEFDRYLANRMQQHVQQQSEGQRQAQQRYEQGYMNTLKAFSQVEEDDAVYHEVISEVTRKDSPFNIKHSDNPMADARINYVEAKLAILNKQLKSAKVVSRENPIKGKSPVAPLGSGSATNSRAPAKDAVLPKLSAEALGVASYFKLTPDAISKALTRK